MALTSTEMDRQQVAKHHHFHRNFFSNMLAVGNETNFQSAPLAKIDIKNKNH